MSSVKRASAAGALAPVLSSLTRGLGAAALVLTTGCSSDVTRFASLEYSEPWPGQGAGYQSSSPAGNGAGIKESSLPPMQAPSKEPRLARDDPPPFGRPAWQARTPDSTAKSEYGPSPWKWADRPPPKWTGGQPLWTDEEPFPWPDPPGKQKTVKSAFQGHYTLKRGDTLPGIAERYKVSLDELKRVNGIADPSKVKVGMVLAIPERMTAGAAAPAAQAAPRVVQVKPIVAPPPEPKAAAEPPPAAVQKVVTKYNGTAGDGPPQPEMAAGRFRWPSRGKVIAGFGAQPDGSTSDGIKLALPMGTDIHAAEAGRVHYAGDGLKGYGNLILIRHANGWVSTYAHADKMLVKVGDEVKRGQVIGKVGMTGPVAQPQLGFELRKGSVPVDPLAYLAN